MKIMTIMSAFSELGAVGVGTFIVALLALIILTLDSE